MEKLLVNSRISIAKDSPWAVAAKSSLQYRLPKPVRSNPTGIINFYEETDEGLLIPRHYFDVLKSQGFDPEVETEYAGPWDFPLLEGECNIRPWGHTEEEEKAQKEAMDFLNVYGVDPPSSDAIVSLPCGVGKTYTAIRAMYDYGYHTLVVAHTADILSNWREDLQKTTEGDEIGSIISGSFDLQPVTLALIQSILALPEDKREEVSRRFGLIVFDEMHHLSAAVFSKVGNMFPGRRIGLTATLAREDGMSWVYYMSLGTRVFSKNVSRKKARVQFKYIRVPDIDLPDTPAKALTAVGESKRYMDVLESDIRGGYQSGEKQLIVSSRKNILFGLRDRLEDLSVGVNTRETPSEERHSNLRTRRVVLSVNTFATEGLNEPSITTLRVVTPFKDRNAVKQVVGRLERYEYEKDAVAVFYAPMAAHFPRTLERAKSNLIREGYFIEKEELV